MSTTVVSVYEVSRWQCRRLLFGCCPDENVMETTIFPSQWWFKSCFIWACFLSLAQSKLRLCLANHRAGYISNLPCDWLSIVWAYSEQDTENGPWILWWFWHTKWHDIWQDRIDCRKNAWPPVKILSKSVIINFLKYLTFLLQILCLWMFW